MHGAGGREKRERRGDDLVTSSHVEGAQRQQQGIRAVGASDGVLDLRKAGNAALKLRDGIAEDERLLIHDVHHRGNDFIANGGVLRLEIEKRNGHSS